MLNAIIYTICFFSVGYCIFSIYKKIQNDTADNRNRYFYEDSLVNMESYYFHIYNDQTLKNFFENVRKNIRYSDKIKTNLIKDGFYSKDKLEYVINYFVYLESESWLELDLSSERKQEFEHIRNDSMNQLKKNNPCNSCPFSNNI